MKKQFIKRLMGLVLSGALIIGSSGVVMASQDVQANLDPSNNVSTQANVDEDETLTIETESAAETEVRVASLANETSNNLKESLKDAKPLETTEYVDGIGDEVIGITPFASSTSVTLSSGNYTLGKYPTVSVGLNSSYTDVYAYFINDLTNTIFSVELDYNSSLGKYGISILVDGSTYNGKYTLYAISYTESSNMVAEYMDSSKYFTITGCRTLAMDDYVIRLYNLVLGRNAAETEVTSWVKQLAEKSKTGADVAQGFLFSNEYKGKKTSDSAYLDVLYKVLLNRNADSVGKNNWQTKLNVGVSRTYIFKGFAESSEFTNICASYGITRGSVSVSENRDKNYGTTAFVSRLYTQALGRSIDVAGLNNWTGYLINKTKTPQQVAEGFINSAEFTGKKLSNENYVKVLYRTYLGRECDNAGYVHWVNKLNSGVSRQAVLNGFAGSSEFKNIVKSFGL